jgi:uncharacterized protein YacL
MILAILRGTFLVLAAAVAMLYALTFQLEGSEQFMHVVFIGLVTIGLALVVIAVDVSTPRKKLSAISGVFLGLIAGLVAAWALSFPVDLIRVVTGRNDPAFKSLLEGAKVFIGLITCYVAISLVLQTKDDFRLVIPYVEFAKQIRGTRPTLLDTSILIDGRILDIVATRILQGTLIVPRFVLDELQALADSADKLRRARGRRGLEVMQKLQKIGLIDVTLQHEDDEAAADPSMQAAGVDQKLLALAAVSKARVMTNDFNLAQIAGVRGIDVINLNDLAQALRPAAIPGQAMHVRLIKPGEGPEQGVGYLDDGTMVVVENGRPLIGQNVAITVTSTIQTSAGRMIFGRPEGGDAAGHPGQHDHA